MIQNATSPAATAIREYGLPGGLWLSYTLDFDRDLYVVTNESGDEVFASADEQACIDFCESRTALPAPASPAPNVNARTVLAIEELLTSGQHVDDETEHVLTYIAGELSPAGLAKRGEDEQDVDHLREVAERRLRAYTTEVPA